MEVKVVNLDNQIVGDKLLSSVVFGLKPRVDIIKLVVDWQMAKRMSGTHATKTVSEVSGTTKKPFKQKGTGNARQGSLRSVHMRGGGVIHGPVVRSHATKLQKKVRSLGLKHALSAKHAEGKLLILESFALANAKTSHLTKVLENFGGKSFFLISDNALDANFSLAIRNIPNAAIVPSIGANVYDIINHDYVLISRSAVDLLEERLK